MHSTFLLGWPKSSFGFFFCNIQYLLVKSYTGKNNYPILGSHPLRPTGSLRSIAEVYKLPALPLHLPGPSDNPVPEGPQRVF